RAVAGRLLGADPTDVELVDGQARRRSDPGRSVSLRRVAGAAHWDPAGAAAGAGSDPGLALTVTFSVPGLGPPDPSDRVNSSAAYGFLVDVAVVELPLTPARVWALGR